jgi:hypothetical protein
MSDHFYTTSTTERDSISAIAYDVEGIAGFVFAGPDAGPIPLLRAWNVNNGDHFYTADVAEYDNAVNSLEYRAEGATGYIYSSQAQGAVPLFRLFSPATGDHFYTRDANEAQNAVSAFGYREEGIAGYVRPDAVDGAGPWYRAYNLLNGDHFYTMDANEHANAVANFGYVDEGITCYLQNSGAVIRVPLYRCWSNEAADHFYTTSLAERDNAVNNLTYRAEGIACYVLTSAIAGAVPFYRLFSAETGDHFYTRDANEAQNAINNLGYISEGIACYIYGDQQPETIPLYRLVQAYDAWLGVNMIVVAGDTWSVAQWNVFRQGIDAAAQIYRQVGVRLVRRGEFIIPAAQAGTFAQIDSDAEAEDLTRDWSYIGWSIDLFGVLAYVGSVAGLSPVSGPCDKQQTKGMSGSVIELTTPLGVIIAHEVGHYLGLRHDDSSPNNLMNPVGAPSNTMLTADQAKQMKTHCFIQRL